MGHVFVALISGLIGVAIGYIVWGSEVSAPETSLQSDPITTEAPKENDSSDAAAATPPVVEPTPTDNVEISGISAEQSALIESFGIDPEGITVTAEMIACAEETLGKERLETILSGAVPTFFESARLLVCYKP